MWDGMNRRCFPRANYPCKVKVYLKHTPAVFLTQTENIGIGGVCVILEKELPRFSQVDLEVDLEDGLSLIKSSGKIVWVVKRTDIKSKKHQFDVGVEFTSLKKEDRQRIDRVVQKALSSNPAKEQEI